MARTDVTFPATSFNRLKFNSSTSIFTGKKPAYEKENETIDDSRTSGTFN
jgi:hypothetical protein